MSTETRVERAAYLMQADGNLVPNSAAAEVEARYREAQADQQALDASWAGARLAGLFLKHAWLDAVTLSFEVNAEYDDSGGFYRCISCNPDAIRAVPQQAVPEESFPNREFDADVAAQILRDEIEDDEFDLYAGLAEWPEGYADMNLSLERNAIAVLLANGTIDGRSACEAWGLAPSPQT